MKNKILFFSILLINTFTINACDQTKSVEYYQQNPKEAEARSRECRAKRIINQDCINAYSVGFPKTDQNAKSLGKAFKQ